ncbi:MAG: hypothetical protein B6244_03140 [Candidatus Cloacimonetes bacterium 4572_55]|nr:MAG: hypothetical protein B6244_03140 [Candidatus Cloacimonetes bacterium 4572_55]
MSFRAILIGIYLSLFILVLSGCQSKKKSKRLLVYTSVPSAIMSEIQAAFEQEYPQIKLSIYRNGTQAIISKISAEEEEGGVNADVVWLAGLSYLTQLKKEGMLHPFKSEHSAFLSSYLRDQDNCFYAGRIITSGIVYNTDIVADEDRPVYWADLWSDQWRNKVVMANPLYSGMAVLTVGTLADTYSWEYFSFLRTNGATVVQSNNAVSKKIASGEFPVGITIDYIITMMRESGSPVDLIYPEDGVIAIPCPLGIFNSSNKKVEAESFINYILSQDGQKLLVQSGAFTPVRSDVKSRPGTLGLDEIIARAFPTDWSKEHNIVENVKRQFSAIMLYWEEE